MGYRDTPPHQSRCEGDPSSSTDWGVSFHNSWCGIPLKDTGIWVNEVPNLPFKEVCDGAWVWVCVCRSIYIYIIYIYTLYDIIIHNYISFKLSEFQSVCLFADFTGGSVCHDCQSSLRCATVDQL